MTSLRRDEARRRTHDARTTHARRTVHDGRRGSVIMIDRVITEPRRHIARSPLRSDAANHDHGTPPLPRTCAENRRQPQIAAAPERWE